MKYCHFPDSEFKKNPEEIEYMLVIRTKLYDTYPIHCISWLNLV